MTYRDRAVQCPRCGLELTRGDAADVWRCGKCAGALLGVAELVKQLLTIAPDLAPEGDVRGLPTIGRKSREPALPCASCGAPLEPVFLGGVELDRCYHDELVWLDAGELERVLAVARKQADARESWLARLLGW